MLGVLLFASALTLATSYSIQSASAQASTVPGTSTAGTFSARGYMAILALPPGIIQAIGGAAHPELQGNVIGGNWSFTVAKGSIQDFKIDLKRVSLGGKTAGTITISGLSNATGATTPSPTNAILLRDNSTSFQGAVNISVNGTAKWKNVPIIVDLINGQLLNVSIDNAKTGNQFLNLPLFGLATRVTPKGL
jgi:hypothetical protein